MVSDKKKSSRTALQLSLEHIKRYFDALPSSAGTGDLAKKKENAEAGLAYLYYFLDSKVGDVSTLSPCGPKPQIPEIP